MRLMRRYALHWPSARVLLSIVIAGSLAFDVALSLGAVSNATHWERVGLRYAYTYNNCTSTSVVDPINVVWYGGPETAGAVGAVLANKGWSYNDFEDPTLKAAETLGVGGVDVMYIHDAVQEGGADSHGCFRNDTERADGNPFSNREHVRLFDAVNTHNKVFVVGDASHDQNIFGHGCTKFLGLAGHITSSFNQSRETINGFWPAHRALHWWGNTYPLRQCNGEYKASDGRTLYASMSGIASASGFHPVNTQPPTISGTAIPGDTLTANPGIWSGNPTTFNYQWCVVQISEDKCASIPGATGSAWTVEASKQGQLIAVYVRPVGAGSDEGAISNVVQIGAVVSDPNCSTNVLPGNDDKSTGAVTLPFTVTYFGKTYSTVFVNNNGNVTFGQAISQWTPEALSSTRTPIIAPFWADVDTRAAASGKVTYGSTTFEGHPTFCVNWPDVGYYKEHTDKLNDFQLLLVGRGDLEPGAFEIVFNYDQLRWETGDANNGKDGLGGTAPIAGFSAGDCNAQDFFELPGSRQNGAFLDSSGTGLIHGDVGSEIPGRYVLHDSASAGGGSSGCEEEHKSGGGGGGGAS
jgi:hypothetical protein